MPPKEQQNDIIERLKALLLQGRTELWQGKRGEGEATFKQGRNLAIQAGLVDEAKVFEASILSKDRRYDEVIDLLRPCVEHDFSMLGHAWDRLAFAYWKKKEFGAAIEGYEKALAEESYDTRGLALLNMGNSYDKSGDPDKAIECYEKAAKELAESSYDHPGSAWYNLGDIWLWKYDADKALEYFTKAANAYKSAGDEENWADAEFRAGLLRDVKQAREEGRSHRAREKENLARLLTSKGDRPLTLERPVREDPRGRIVAELNKHSVASNEYHDKGKESGLNHVLAVLKGWSSAIPIVARVRKESFGNQACRGGGYFIKAGKQGLVVDPGYDFLETFTDCGFHIREVTDVIVSHNHPDHRDDLTSIADLENQHVRGLPDAATPRRTAYYLDPDTNNMYRPLLRDCNVGVGSIRQLEPDEPKTIPPEVRCLPFKTDHGGDQLHQPVGFVLELPLPGKKKPFRLGYTSDTEYFDELPGKFDRCRLIICHFSSARPDDYVGKKKRNGHLGYTGLLNLIKNTKADMYVVSEFWGGKGDVRFELVQKLKFDLAGAGRRETERILAGDAGLMIDLLDLTVRCSQCLKWCDYGAIWTVKPDVRFGKLRYLCDQCLT
ncbi:MAG: tetratricopeptide repeat protein [candidate division WOR-3 bacterium]|nr:MAG: tetratricopeptide repeat protein [candidate division WOR-3 bacterium]